MLIILKYIGEFYQKEFNRWYFFLVLLMMGILVYLNYRFAQGEKYVADSGGFINSFGRHYLLYLIPFAASFFLQRAFFKQNSYFKDPWFWVILILAPAIFSYRVNFNLHYTYIKAIWRGYDQLFWLKSIGWVVKVIVVLFPVFIIWQLKDKGNQPFYGTKKIVRIAPYITMLLMMLPLIILAATQKDFLSVYPQAKVLQYPGKILNTWQYLVYELCYGLDFVSIEFFFRGFLVLSLAKICGSRCIIPMACFYCSIHLGKPMAEAVSSFFGGILLGIISYNIRSIWGGLIVHLGIAWVMEALSWLVLFLKS